MLPHFRVLVVCSQDLPPRGVPDTDSKPRVRWHIVFTMRQTSLVCSSTLVWDSVELLGRERGGERKEAKRGDDCEANAKSCYVVSVIFPHDRFKHAARHVLSGEQLTRLLGHPADLRRARHSGQPRSSCPPVCLADVCAFEVAISFACLWEAAEIQSCCCPEREWLCSKCFICLRTPAMTIVVFSSTCVIGACTVESRLLRESRAHRARSAAARRNCYFTKMVCQSCLGCVDCPPSLRLALRLATRRLQPPPRGRRAIPDRAHDTSLGALARSSHRWRWWIHVRGCFVAGGAVVLTEFFAAAAVAAAAGRRRI